MFLLSKRFKEKGKKELATEYLPKMFDKSIIQNTHTHKNKIK